MASCVSALYERDSSSSTFDCCCFSCWWVTRRFKSLFSCNALSWPILSWRIVPCSLEFSCLREAISAACCAYWASAVVPFSDRLLLQVPVCYIIRERAKECEHTNCNKGQNSNNKKGPEGTHDVMRRHVNIYRNEKSSNGRSFEALARSPHDRSLRGRLLHDDLPPPMRAVFEELANGDELKDDAWSGDEGSPKRRRLACT